MSDSIERVEFIYTSTDNDDGYIHEVRDCKEKTCLNADELCKMFLDFMELAGFSIHNVWDYFQNC